MATALGLGSQDIKPGGVGGGAGTSASGGTIGSGGAATATAPAPTAVAATGADAHPAPAETGMASKASNDVVPLIPLDLERRKISLKTKKLVLAKLGVATKAEDDINLATTTSDHTVSPSTAAEADKSDLPAVSAPNPSEQQDPRTSPSALTPSSDLEKKQRRAERFGLDLQISESEKRTIRAARFGATTGSTDQSIKAATPSSGAESEKRKARAARFGSNDAKDVKEAPVVGKKAARAARFGLELKTDDAEVEKRKARAARFGASPHAETDSSKKARLADVSFVASV